MPQKSLAEFKAEKNRNRSALKAKKLLEQGKRDEALVYLKRAEDWEWKRQEAQRWEWQQQETAVRPAPARPSRPIRRTPSPRKRAKR